MALGDLGYDFKRGSSIEAVEIIFKENWQ
jgi:hypothetical protein